MFNFKEALASLGDECLEHFGEPIFINGIEVRAVFEDETFEEEAGLFRKTTLSIKKEDTIRFKEGDSVLVRDRNYVVTYIPDIDEPLVDLELKSA
jgi:hypothetical protein